MGLIDSLNININVRTTGATQVNQLKRSFQDTTSTIDKFVKISTNAGLAMKRLGNGMANTSVMIAKSAFNLTKEYGEYEKTILTAKRATGVTAQEMKYLTPEINKMALATGTANTELMGYMASLGRSGLIAGFQDQLEQFNRDGMTSAIPFELQPKFDERDISKALLEGTRVMENIHTVFEKFSEDDADQLFKIFDKLKDPQAGPMEAIKQLRGFGDELAVLANILPGNEIDALIGAGKFVGLASIAKTSRIEFLAMVGSMQNMNEQLRTAANAFTSFSIEVAQKPTQTLELFREELKALGITTEEELKKAFATPEKFIPTLMTLYGTYGKVLTENVDRANEMNEAYTSLGATVQNRIGVNTKTIMGFNQEMGKMMEGSKFEQIRKELQGASGFLEKKAKEMHDSAYGFIKKLEESISQLKQRMGAELMPMVGDLAQALGRAITYVTKFKNEHKEVFDYIIQNGGKFLIWGFVAGKMISLAGDITLVSGGLLNMVKLLGNGSLLAVFGIPAIIAAGILYQSNSFDDFSKNSLEYIKQFKEDFTDAFTEIGKLISNLATKLKEAFSSDSAEGFFSTLSALAAKGITVALKTTAAGAEAANNYLTGENQTKNQDDFYSMMNVAPLPTINPTLSVGGGIGDNMENNTALAIADQAAEFIVKIFETAGQFIWDTCKFLGKKTAEGIDEAWSLWKTGIMDGAIAFVQGFNKIKEDLSITFLAVTTAIKVVFESNLLNPARDFAARVSTGFKSAIDVLDNALRHIHTVLVGWYDWFLGEDKPVMTEPTNRDPTDAEQGEILGSLGGGQTGRVVRTPTRMLIGEVPEVVTPLDQHSATRGSKLRGGGGGRLRGGGGGAPIITPANVTIVLKEKVIGQATIEFKMQELENQYGFVPTTGTGVGI